MFLRPTYDKILLLIVILSLNCQDYGPASPVTGLEKPPPSGLQRLHGYWKVVNDQLWYRYLVADTMISRFVAKIDLGFGSNFRYTIDYPVIFTDSTILGRMTTPWLYYHFSQDSDTLFASTDSLFSYPIVAVADPNPSASQRWSPSISYEKKTWMRKFRVPSVTAADRYGDYWYLHYPTYMSSTIEVRNLNGDTAKTIVFPGGTTCDIARGFLWIAGSFFVEKRNLEDTTLIQRIDLSSQYSFQSYDRIYAMAVSESQIYAVIEDHLLSFDDKGVLMNDLAIPDVIWSISFVGNTLIATTNHSTVNTIDVSTGHATESYMFPESLYGDTVYPVTGIVDLGDRLAAFRSTEEGIYLYEFTYPQ